MMGNMTDEWPVCTMPVKNSCLFEAGRYQIAIIEAVTVPTDDIAYESGPGVLQVEKLTGLCEQKYITSLTR